MLGRRSPQRELFRPDHTLSSHVGEETFYGWLAKHGPEWFQDEDFAGLYREDFGRPSVPPSQLCIALLLQTHEGASDEEAIERSAYDLRWKVALGLELEEKLCAKSTLQLFRAKLIVHEAYGQLLEKSVGACRAAGLMKRRKLEAAVDTTPILGRGAVKDTYNLVSDAIRRVVVEACALKHWDAEVVVAEQGLGRHFGSSFKGAVELDWSDPGARRALVAQLVADARVALELAKSALRGYAGDSEVTGKLREVRDLLADVLQQDIDEAPADGGGPQIRRGTARDRIVSTTDPEMRHGHKSHSKGFEGYKASVVVESENGVILAVDAQPANAPDREGAKELVAEAVERSGQELERVLGDTAYGDSETRRELTSLGAEVIAKAPPGTRRGYYGLEDFRIDPRRGLARCPAGKRSIRRDRVKGEDPGWRYIFSRRDCGPCALRTQCTKSRVAARVVQVTAKTRELQRLRRGQRTKHFQRCYRRRVVAEHALARMVRRGLRQARYFGRVKVTFQTTLIGAVTNLSLAAGVGALRPLCQALQGVWAALKIPRPAFMTLYESPRVQRAPSPELLLLGFGMPETAPSRPGL
jgi:transposase